MSNGETATGQEAPGEASAPASPAPARISRGRLIGVDVLIGITTLLALVGILAVWANRLLFNPGNWSKTSTQLLQNPAIRDATANYAVDQLYANVNVAQLIRSGLPPRLQPLAGPAAGALRGAAVKGVDAALARPRVQSLWATANRVADQQFVNIVNGKAGPVGLQGGVVSLDLAGIIDNVASRLGLPPNLGAKLPPSIGHLTIFKSKQLSFLQDVAGAVKGLALWLSILVPVLYALAILLARNHRRRTLMTVGFAIVLAGIAGLAGRSILDSQITNSLVSDESLRSAVSATVVIATGILAEISDAFVLVGLVIVAVAWFAGPAHLAVLGRRAIAPFMRHRPALVFGIVVMVMVLIFIWEPIHATGTPVGIVVFMALALLGTELLRRQIIAELPDVSADATATAARARIQGLRDARERRKQTHNANETALPEQLERLVKLRDGGAISSEEYEAAKARLLNG